MAQDVERWGAAAGFDDAAEREGFARLREGGEVEVERSPMLGEVLLGGKWTPCRAHRVGASAWEITINVTASMGVVGGKRLPRCGDLATLIVPGVWDNKGRIDDLRVEVGPLVRELTFFLLDAQSAPPPVGRVGFDAWLLSLGHGSRRWTGRKSDRRLTITVGEQSTDIPNPCGRQLTAAEVATLGGALGLSEKETMAGLWMAAAAEGVGALCAQVFALWDRSDAGMRAASAERQRQFEQVARTAPAGIDPHRWLVACLAGKELDGEWMSQHGGWARWGECLASGLLAREKARASGATPEGVEEAFDVAVDLVAPPHRYRVGWISRFQRASTAYERAGAAPGPAPERKRLTWKDRGPRLRVDWGED